MNGLWGPADLSRQFMAAKAEGWLPFFEDAAKQYSIPVEILLAIGSRETNLKNIKGDGGHGHGIMQIDDRSFPAWCRGGRWRDPQEAIRMGAFVLKNDIDQAKKWLPNEKYDKTRAAIAAYNAGKHAFVSYALHGNPDLATTGKDYSADVLNRSLVFARLLGEDKT